jgi:hypothetical protein
MSKHRFTRPAALALAICALAATPAAAAPQDHNPAANPPETADELGETQDLRSPDARDAAEGRGTWNAPDVTVIRVAEPSSSPASDGLDWGDAGIGAGGLLGLILIGSGGALLVVHRRQGASRQPATTG